MCCFANPSKNKRQIYILHAQVSTQLTSPSTKNSSNRCSAKHANQIPKYKKTRETDTGQTQNWHPQVQKTQATDTSQTENWHPQVPKVQVTNAGPKKITIYKSCNFAYQNDNLIMKTQQSIQTILTENIQTKTKNIEK